MFSDSITIGDIVYLEIGMKLKLNLTVLKLDKNYAYVSTSYTTNGVVIYLKVALSMIKQFKHLELCYGQVVLNTKTGYTCRIHGVFRGGTKNIKLRLSDGSEQIVNSEHWIPIDIHTQIIELTSRLKSRTSIPIVYSNDDVLSIISSCRKPIDEVKSKENNNYFETRQTVIADKDSAEGVANMKCLEVLDLWKNKMYASVSTKIGAQRDAVYESDELLNSLSKDIDSFNVIATEAGKSQIAICRDNYISDETRVKLKKLEETSVAALHEIDEKYTSVKAFLVACESFEQEIAVLTKVGIIDTSYNIIAE